MTKNPNKRLIDAMYHYYNSHSRRVSQHYIHAYTKHPYFCDALFSERRKKCDGGAENHLKLGRKLLKDRMKERDCDFIDVAELIIDMSRQGGNDSGHIGTAKNPIRTITTFDNVQGVFPLLEDGRVIDIRIRMLKPSELAAAHSFPKDFVLMGNRAEQVKQIGNSVPVMTAKAMVRSTFE